MKVASFPWLRLLGILALIGVIVALLATRAMAHLNLNLLVYALAVQPINALAALLAALRLAVLGWPGVKVWSAAKATALAATLLYVLPSRFSEVIKPIYLADRSNLPFTRMVSVVALERLSDLVVVAVVVAIAAHSMPDRALAAAAPSVLALAGVGVAGFVLFSFFPGWFERMARFLPHPLLRGAAISMIAHVRTIASPGRSAAALVLGAAAWFGSLATAHLFLNLAGSIPLPFEATILVFLAGTLGLAVGVVPGSLGTYEAAIVVTLQLYGYTLGEGLALAVGMRLSSLGVLGFLALYTISREHIGISSLRSRISDLIRASREGREAPSRNPLLSSGARLDSDHQTERP